MLNSSKIPSDDSKKKQEPANFDFQLPIGTNPVTLN
jgi:hypothetical protein